jgi:PadR family transcriptional regulator PadR
VAEKKPEGDGRVTPKERAGPAAPGTPPFPAAPRDLLTAYMLLLLRNWSMHGYQIWQQLTENGYQPTDSASIKRQLRQLERQGFIRSNWETGEAGPARRTYTLTEAGDAFLNTWATAIEGYQKTLKFWTDLYSGMATPRRSE